jgi:hypothetical protein
MQMIASKGPAFSPDLHVSDALAAYWIQQASVRLRREICWIRHERGVSSETDKSILPAFMERASESLGLSRHWEEKQIFFQNDSTAHYLTEQLDQDPPATEASCLRNSLSGAVGRLNLDAMSQFILGLGLLVAFDNAAGSVIATCLNDPAKTLPNLALAQRLWDDPENVLSLADPMHVLYQYGLLRQTGGTSASSPALNWDSPVNVPMLVAKQLLFSEIRFPESLNLVCREDNKVNIEISNCELIAARIGSSNSNGLRIVPIRAPKGSCHTEAIAAIANKAGRTVLAYAGDGNSMHENNINSMATLCWLYDMDLYVGHDRLKQPVNDRSFLDPQILPSQSIPITLFLGIIDSGQLARVPEKCLLPIVDMKGLTYDERVKYWKKSLENKGDGLDQTIKECSRRFRYERETIDSICSGLRNYPGTITETIRNELELDLGDLAQKVHPRFKDKELILPPKQRKQFEELVKAMNSLTEVHYGWGTAKVWNEGGISALFAGPPGTGKTMAAEVLAHRLGLPIFRIDLSQVVNKYIGETEKNLKRLFDTADISDMILFFDEADSLFGRRTEVKDAHDRYANLEISYLLERMERFKGLAILATNRKKDLDEAFLRRLRYIIDFSLPNVAQRKKIWRHVIPQRVDKSELDFDFLAGHFPLVGGHIRSIVFNACLQSTNGSSPEHSNMSGKLTMEQVIISIKREYQKLNRSISLEHFGPYKAIVERLENARD